MRIPALPHRYRTFAHFQRTLPVNTLIGINTKIIMDTAQQTNQKGSISSASNTFLCKSAIIPTQTHQTNETRFPATGAAKPIFPGEQFCRPTYGQKSSPIQKASIAFYSCFEDEIVPVISHVTAQYQKCQIYDGIPNKDFCFCHALPSSFK